MNFIDGEICDGLPAPSRDASQFGLFGGEEEE